MDDTTAATRDELKGAPSASRVSRIWQNPKARQVARVALDVYVILLALAVTGQAVLLFLLWGPQQNWISFGARFVTSPAMAGLFAVIAAVIGAWSLYNQLAHTKEKAADEAWWQQFEWVTDRIIFTADKDGKEETRLPLSLAFDLMTSLSSTARAPFQKDAVGGILEYYVEGFREQGSRSPQGSESAPVDGPSMNAAGAKSLRNLLDALPEKTPSSASARQVLQAYEYEEEVQRALKHRFGATHSLPAHDSGADAIVEVGSQRILVEVKLYVPSAKFLEGLRRGLRATMEHEGAVGAVIITPKTSDNDPALKRLQHWSKYGIHLIEWDPAEGSSALQDKIRAIANNS